MFYRVPEDNKWYNLDPEKVESLEEQEQEQEQEKEQEQEQQENDTDSTSENLDDSVTSLESGRLGGFHW